MAESVFSSLTASAVSGNSATANSSSGSAKADLIKWSGGDGIAFFTKSTEIRGVKDITIGAQVQLDEDKDSKQTYVKKKDDGSYEITLTAVLNAALGVSVKTLALKMTEAARKGQNGYFYIGGKKLFPCSFMATEAKISNVCLSGKGAWISCEVAWTLKQCSKYGGGTETTSTSSSGSSGGSSTKKAVTTSSKKSGSGWISDLKDTLSDAVKNAQATTQTAKAAAVQAYQAITGAAKKSKTSTSSGTSTVTSTATSRAAQAAKQKMERLANEYMAGL